MFGTITDANAFGERGREIGRKTRRRDILFPAGVGKMFSVHGTHGAHADQTNCRLLMKRVIWADVDGNGHGWER